MEQVDVYVDSSEKVLAHKLKDGMLSKDRYCYWTRKAQFREVADLVCPKLSKNYVADKIREAASFYDIVGYPKAWVWMIRQEEDVDYIDDEYDVRLHFRINKKEVGYFRCFGANLKFTELWFHSEHFVPVDAQGCGFWIRDKETGVAAFRCGDKSNRGIELCDKCLFKKGDTNAQTKG